MHFYRQAPPYPTRQFPFFFGAPFIGGLFGGLLGSAILRPRPYPYPPYFGGPFYPPYW